jgi:hypothetical protein
MYPEMGLVGVDWIHLVKFRVRWRAAVNTVMNPHVPQYAGNFMLPELLTSRDSRVLMRVKTCSLLGMFRCVGWYFVLGMLRVLSWQQPTHARRGRPHL